MIDPLISKRQQLLLATQLCRMVLKVRYSSFWFHFISFHTDPCFFSHFPFRHRFTLSSHLAIPMPCLAPLLLAAGHIPRPPGTGSGEAGKHPHKSARSMFSQALHGTHTTCLRGTRRGRDRIPTNSCPSRTPLLFPPFPPFALISDANACHVGQQCDYRG